MDLQGFIQSLLSANTLELPLKQKPCTKDSKFYETWEVQSLLEDLFLCFHYLLVCLIQGLQKNNSAYLAGWQQSSQCFFSEFLYQTQSGGSRRSADDEGVLTFCL